LALGDISESALYFFSVLPNSFSQPFYLIFSLFLTINSVSEAATLGQFPEDILFSVLSHGAGIELNLYWMYTRESLGWDKTRSGQVRLVQFSLEFQGGCPLFIGTPGTGKMPDLFKRKGLPQTSKSLKVLWQLKKKCNFVGCLES
jgi:hypothetical protein